MRVKRNGCLENVVCLCLYARRIQVSSLLFSYSSILLGFSCVCICVLIVEKRKLKENLFGMKIRNNKKMQSRCCLEYFILFLENSAYFGIHMRFFVLILLFLRKFFRRFMLSLLVHQFLNTIFKFSLKSLLILFNISANWHYFSFPCVSIWKNFLFKQSH